MRLREWRKRRLLSQAELAALSGVSIVTITRIETGKVGGRPSTLRKLAAALDITADELLGLDSGPGKAAA